jgi:hypothetical protein
VFYLPGRPGFGMALPGHYVTVTHFDDDGFHHQEKLTAEVGDYARIYEGVHESILHGAPKIVGGDQTIGSIQILHDGLAPMIEREQGERKARA